jgi:hypothetical protein
MQNSFTGCFLYSVWPVCSQFRRIPNFEQCRDSSCCRRFLTVRHFSVPWLELLSVSHGASLFSAVTRAVVVGFSRCVTFQCRDSSCCRWFLTVRHFSVPWLELLSWVSHGASLFSAVTRAVVVGFSRCVTFQCRADARDTVTFSQVFLLVLFSPLIIPPSQ